MAAGDAAAAAGYTVQPGTIAANTIDTAMALIQDDLANKTGNKGAPIPYAKLTGVRASGNVPWSEVSSKPTTFAPSLHTHDWIDITGEPALVTLGYLNDRIAAGASVPIYSAGGAATSGYTIAYINGDDRISRGASSERFKKYISQVDPEKLGDIFPDLYRFQMKSSSESKSDNAWHYGHIAERLAEVPELAPFVIWETEKDGVTLARDSFGLPVPLSIDFIALLLAQNAQINQRLKKLEGGGT